MNCAWPPTPIVIELFSSGALEACPEGELPLPPQAIRKSSANPASADFFRRPLLSGGEELAGCLRFPAYQAALGGRDRQLDRDHDDAEYDHPRPDTGCVEVALGLRDHVADSARRPDVLADNSPHHGEAHRRMQAGEDPAHG